MVTGVLTGAGGAHQTIRLVLGSQRDNSSHQIQVTPDIACKQNQVTGVLIQEPINKTLYFQARISFKLTNSDDEDVVTNSSLSQLVPCVSYDMRHVSVPHQRRVHHVAAAGDTRDCVTCFDTWVYWLQPHNWLDTSWPVSRVIINVVVCVIIILSVIIFVKIMRMCVWGGETALCCFINKDKSLKSSKTNFQFADLILKELKDFKTVKRDRNDFNR